MLLPCLVFSFFFLITEWNYLDSKIKKKKIQGRLLDFIVLSFFRGQFFIFPFQQKSKVQLTVIGKSEIQECCLPKMKSKSQRMRG